MKKTMAFILTLTMLLGLCACGSSGGGKTAEKDNYDVYAEKYGEIEGLYRDVTIASRMDIQNLQPTSGTAAPKDEFYWNIYETLFDLDEKENLYADLAKGYEAAPDGSYWDIFLFEDITDTEGNDITAEDCVTSFDWLVGAGEALKYEDVKSWEAVDTYTFRIYWNEAPSSPDDYEFPLARTYIFDSKYTGADFATQPVGTGNYAVADFVTGNHLTLWARPDYWAYNSKEDLSGRLKFHDANVQMLTYEIISESATAEVALEEGKIDFCSYITQQASIDKFREKFADKYNVDDTHVAATYFFLEPNMDKASILSGDENLRLAIYYGLNNETIATLMGSSYVPMKTLGHRGFNDFNVEWENEETYVSVYDTEKAKDYLSKSNYKGEDLNIVCKTSEIEKNAAQSIMSQLLALGITCHVTSIDNSIWTNETSDPTKFDLMVFEMGGPSLIGSLGLPLGQPNTSEDGSDAWSLNFIRDDELYNLIETAKQDANHDDEHVKGVIDYALGHSYIYPMAYAFTCYIYNKDITDIRYREKVVTPAACVYTGQTWEDDFAKPVDAADEGGFDPKLAGTYTYSEPPKFGDGLNEFTLTLKDDGSYRLDETNNDGKKVFAEGTWTVDGSGNVVCSAAPVQGETNRMLVDWVSDFENVDPVFTVRADGTMTPVIPVDLAEFAGSYTYSEKGDFGSKNHDFTLTLNADGTYRLDCNNAVGENIYTEGTFEINADGDAVLSASPVKGDMDKMLNAGWADADNPAPIFTVDTEKGTMFPAGFEPAEEVAPAEGEPAILGALESNGFERFDFWEVNEGMGKIFNWHVMKSDGMVIVIQENEFVGTEDGLLVYHYTAPTEDKGVLHLEGLEDGDKALPQLGGYWNEDGSMDWQIFGPGKIFPVNMEGADAYKDAVNAGLIPEKAEEAPAPEDAPTGEQPQIISALTGMGFECFDWTEESPVGQLPWHVLINKGNGEAIIVVENPMMGTEDGLLVYHCTFTEEKGLVSCSAPEEPDSQVKRLGSMWNADGTSQWQITGPGIINPIEAAK